MMSTSTSGSKPVGQNKPFKSVICHYCKKVGHVISDCLKLKRKQQGPSETKPTGFIASSPPVVRLGSPVRETYQEIPSRQDEFTAKASSSHNKPIMEIFEPFIHDGFVSLSGDLSNATYPCEDFKRYWCIPVSFVGKCPAIF
jgi:hypothetical protein